ncbi:zona pellucida sperm-binding protein 4-like isoform X2 [Nelusetta ayraudi]
MVQSNIHGQDITGATINVLDSEDSCGVTLTREKNQSLAFLSRYDSCYAQIEDGKLAIQLQVQLRGDPRWYKVKISCPLPERRSNRIQLILTSLPGNCDLKQTQRVPCATQGLSEEACLQNECCYDPHDFTCNNRLDACSLDGHFVFSVMASDTDPPIDPRNLIVRDHPHCSPVKATKDEAIFKFGVMDCGTKSKADGDAMIYEVDLVERNKSAQRNSQFLIQVQCEYSASDLKRAADLQSLYAVTNPPPVVAQGAIRVLMRIAKDASFTSFYPEDQLPLTLPLHKAAYVEISIAQPPPDPTLSLRVQDCFAYPESRHSVWMLLYDGCPNPLDNMRSSVPVDKQGRTTSHSQVRRFDVKTFAFVDPQTGLPSAEEIYFYCWVKICTQDTDCAQQCSIISSEGKQQRHRRAARSELEKVQLVSVGPLLMGRNGTQVGETLCVKQKRMFQVAVYMLSVMGATLLLILIFTIWMSFRKQKSKPKQDGDALDGSDQSQ